MESAAVREHAVAEPVPKLASAGVRAQHHCKAPWPAAAALAWGCSATSCVTRPARRSASVNRQRLMPQALEAYTAKLVAPCGDGRRRVRVVGSGQQRNRAGSRCTQAAAGDVVPWHPLTVSRSMVAPSGSGRPHSGSPNASQAGWPEGTRCWLTAGAGGAAAGASGLATRAGAGACRRRRCGAAPGRRHSGLQRAVIAC